MTDFLKILADALKSTSPSGTLNLADFAKALLVALLHSGLVATAVAALTANAPAISAAVAQAFGVPAPLAAALVAGGIKLATAILARYSTGPAQ